MCYIALEAGGRAGLVGTNTIRQNEGRTASLDYVLNQGGTITEAVSTQVWSGEAAVHVSIVNWIKGKQSGNKWLSTQVGDHPNSPWIVEDFAKIGPALSSGIDVTSAVRLVTNRKPKRCFQGQNPVNQGFFLESNEAERMIRADNRNRDVIFPYMIGRDLVEDYGPTRRIIDFAQRDQFDARTYVEPWQHVEERVMPDVIARAEREKEETGKEVTRWTRMANRWWQFRDYMPGTMSAIAPLSRYIMCPRVTKRPIFEFISTEIHPDGATMVFPFEDDYSFGMLQSGIHFVWFRAKCSTLKADFRYTSDTVFDTFPWPQTPTKEEIREVADAAVALRKLRRETMDKLKYSLRQLYRTLEQPGDNPLREAHARLDTAVRAAFEMPEDTDPLAFLLELNLACAEKEKAGEKITPPGLPPLPNASPRFVTIDCIQASTTTGARS